MDSAHNFMAAHHGAHPYVAKSIYQGREEYLNEKNDLPEIPPALQEGASENKEKFSDQSYISNTCCEHTARLLSSGTNLNNLAVCSGINLANDMTKSRDKKNAHKEQKVSATLSHVALAHASSSCGTDHSALGNGKHRDLPRAKQGKVPSGTNQGKMQANINHVSPAATNKEGPTSSDHQGWYVR
jgi:hypothetical protein